MEAAQPVDQVERLAALRDYEVLDTASEPKFDEICRLASQICDAPVSLISLIDEGRQWFKAEVGLGMRETPLASSICAHAILEPDFFEISDTAADPRAADNPLVAGDPRLRFYAGAQLRTSEGLALGTLCVLDYRPRELTPFQRDALGVLSRQVMAQLDLRLALRRQDLLRREIDHRVKNSLAAVAAVLRLQLRGSTDPAVIEALRQAETRVDRIALLHAHLYRASSAHEVDLQAYLGEISAMLEGTAPDSVEILTEAAPVAGDARTAAQIGVIVSEFVLNSAKHGFPDGRSGWVKITLRPGESGGLDLRCEDNGVGRAGGAASSGGLGLRLMKASAEQARGDLRMDEDSAGFAVDVRFPPAPQTGIPFSSALSPA